MTETLAPRLLDRGMIDQAFPLVRNLVAGITLERWASFARAKIASRSAEWPHGLMTVQNPKGYILALFTFEVRDDLLEGRMLCIDNIVLPNIPGRDLIWSSVAGAAEQLGTIHGCRAIRAGLGDELDPSEPDRAWVIASLEKSGYALDGMRAFKRMGQAGADSREGGFAAHCSSHSRRLH